MKWLSSQAKGREEERQLTGGFTRSTCVWRSLFNVTPAGWGRRSRRQLARVVGDTDRFVQRLNDTFADPSGGKTAKPAVVEAGKVEPVAAVSTPVTAVSDNEPHG
jgi:hypothetical protein